jgi:hypothetical protein
MKINTDIVILVCILIAIATLVINISVWNECRVDHSFFYCLRLITK